VRKAASLALGQQHIPSSAYMKVRQLKDLFYDLAIMRVRAEAVTPQRHMRRRAIEKCELRCPLVSWRLLPIFHVQLD
jgi:hypothetical protein